MEVRQQTTFEDRRTQNEIREAIDRFLASPMTDEQREKYLGLLRKAFAEIGVEAA